jgi:hypothetical protein
MNRIAALTLASFAALFAACQNSPPAPQVAPAPPPPVVVVAPATPAPPAAAAAMAPAAAPAAGPTVASVFGSAKHLVVEVRQVKAGKQDLATKSLDDQIPAVIAALGADHGMTNAMPRCMTPVTFTFSDATNTKIGSVGFCDTGTPAEVLGQPGRIDFSATSFGGFVAQDPVSLAKFLP